MIEVDNLRELGEYLEKFAIHIYSKMSETENQMTNEYINDIIKLVNIRKEINPNNQNILIDTCTYLFILSSILIRTGGKEKHENPVM